MTDPEPIFFDPHRQTKLICPLTAGTLEQMSVDMATAAEEGADAIELRLDYLDAPPSDDQLRKLLDQAPLDVIVTCRPLREGGKYDGPEYDRLRLLCTAANRGATAIDIERDVPLLDSHTVDDAGVSLADIILSHHDFETVPEDLDDLLAFQDASPASINKIAFTATAPQDALRALDLLRKATKPTIALAMGDAGLLSRILARKFGAYGTFGALRDGQASAPGQPTLGEFHHRYRWDQLEESTSVYGVVGCPIGHSMSPDIHNAAFTAAGVDGVYLPLLVQPGADNFNHFLDALRTRPWLDVRGLSVTIPHKENALAYVGADHCDALAVAIGAVNTLTFEPDGSLRGDNTDYAAAIDALVDAMSISREDLATRRVAVIGAGGVSRAIVAALAHYRANVVIYNRTLARAESLAKEFACEAKPLDALDGLDAEIVINCTSVGMHPNVHDTPVQSLPDCVKVVFDTIYNPIETKLLTLARDAGAICVSGLEMFVNQAVEQFQIWTGQPAPRNEMRAVVVQRLTHEET